MSYHSFETLILSLALVFSLWLALRKAAPKLSQRLGTLLHKAGLPERVASRLFGSAASCTSGCGSCGGCEKPAGPASLSFHRKP